MVVCSYFRTQISTRTNQLSIEIALMSIAFFFSNIEKCTHFVIGHMDFELESMPQGSCLDQT